MKTRNIVLATVVFCLGAGLFLFAWHRQTEHAEQRLDDALYLKIAFRSDPFTWLDPIVNKHIHIENRETGAVLDTTLESLEWDTHFETDSANSHFINKRCLRHKDCIRLPKSETFTRFLSPRLFARRLALGV